MPTVVFGYKEQNMVVLSGKNFSRSRTGPQREEGLLLNAT